MVIILLCNLYTVIFTRHHQNRLFIAKYLYIQGINFGVSKTSKTI